MKLVEVVRGAQTSDHTVATAVDYVHRIGKLPIVVNDGPGFLVNRLLTPYLNESLALLCEGVRVEEIDQAAVAYGMPLGPMALYDLIGIDTAFYAGRGMWEAFPDRVAVSPVLPALFRNGRLGRKTGRGFFAYRNGSDPPQPDPEVPRLLEPYVRRQREYSREEITARLFLPVLVEATRVLEGGIVRDPRDVDLGIIFGLGFPRFRGGLLFWADTLGAASVVEQLKPWSTLGVRYRPTEMLVAMARDNRKFYDRRSVACRGGSGPRHEPRRHRRLRPHADRPLAPPAGLLPRCPGRRSGGRLHPGPAGPHGPRSARDRRCAAGLRPSSPASRASTWRGWWDCWPACPSRPAGPRSTACAAAAWRR